MPNNQNKNQSSSDDASKKSLSQDEVSKLFGTFNLPENKIEEASSSTESPPKPITRKRAVAQEDLDMCYAIIESIQGQTAAKDNANFERQIQDAILVERGLSQEVSIVKAIVGIDISRTSVKLIHVDKNNVIHCMEAMTIEKNVNESLEQNTANAIKILLGKCHVLTKRVVVSHSDDHFKMRAVQLPKLNKSEVLKALTFEAQKLNPKIDPKTLHISNLVLEKETDQQGAKILLMSTDKIQNIRTAAIIKMAGLEPIAVDSNALSLARYYRYVFEPFDAGITILVEMRSTHTTLSFMDGNQFVWAQPISIGGDDFTLAISTISMINMDMADKLKVMSWSHNTDDAGKLSELSRAIQPVYERFSTEVRRTIQFFITHSGEQNIARLVLSGTSSKMANFENILSRQLSIPVVRWNNRRNFDCSKLLIDESSFESMLPQFASVLGLCFWNAEKDTVNFLPSKRQIRQLKTAQATNVGKQTSLKMPRFSFHFNSAGSNVYLLAPILLFALVVISGYFYVEQQSVDADLAHYRSQFNAQLETRNKIDHLRKVRTEVAQLTKEIDKLNQQKNQIALPLSVLSNVISEHIHLVNMKIDSGVFTINGYSKNTATIDQFIDKLLNTSHFTEIKVGVVKKSDLRYDTRKYFEIYFTPLKSD